jgi:single-strand DNA-binding protein
MSKIYTNAITLKGFLGKNATPRTNANQTPIVVLSLATKSSYKDKHSGEFVSRTDWHRIVAFGKLADSAKSLVKGAYVVVEGELQSREYTPDSDSNKRRVWEVRARSITQLERPPRGVAENLDAEPAEEVPA